MQQFYSQNIFESDVTNRQILFYVNSLTPERYIPLG